jgi:two-component system sensor histidine kinase CpxA
MKARLTLSAKVLLLAALNLALLLAVVLVFVRIQFRVDLESFLVAPAQDRILAMARQIGMELDDTDPAAWDDLLLRYSRDQNAELRLFGPDGRQLAGPKTGLPEPLAARLAGGREHGGRGGRGGRGRPLYYLGTAGSPSRHWVGVLVPLPSPDGRRGKPGFLLMASTSGSLFFVDPKPWLAVGSAVLLLSALCWLPFVRGVTRSVARMTRATGQISEGRFDVQLPVSRRDELGQLSGSINSMAARLKRLVAGQKRFLGDAAHELCSPLARLRVGLGILEQSATEEQAQVLADLQEDAAQMSALAGEILSFSKAGLRPPDARLETVSLAETAAQAIDREAGAARVASSISPDVCVLADRDLLFRALSNVIRNAVRYAGAAGPIEIAAQAHGPETAIFVRDCGPGLAPEDLEAVFEPFYRPEAARTREGGGAGLGLAIVRSCVEACQGTVSCRNRTPAGLEVEIRLKTAPPPSTVS